MGLKGSTETLKGAPKLGFIFFFNKKMNDKVSTWNPHLTPDFCREDDQLGPTALANELRIGGLLSCSRIIQHLVSWLHGGVVCRPRARTPTWCRWPTELPGTGSSHPQPLQGVVRLWCSRSRCKVQVSHEHVGHHPPHQLPNKPVPRLSPERSPRRPRTPTRAHACAMMATRVEKTATSATTRGERKREAANDATTGGGTTGDQTVSPGWMGSM